MSFDALFERLYPQLFRYLHRLTADPDVAADAAQESFVRLLDHPLPEHEAKRWLFTVGTNLVRDGSRARTRRDRLSPAVRHEAAEVEAPDREVERGEEVAAVRAALEEIPERDRTILLMREEGFRYREIADAIGVQESSVGTLLARATQRFVEAYGHGEGHGDTSG